MDKSPGRLYLAPPRGGAAAATPARRTITGETWVWTSIENGFAQQLPEVV